MLVTPASANDIKAMEHILYEKESFYIFVFLTNNFSLSANEIASLYKNRWQTVSERRQNSAILRQYCLLYGGNSSKRTEN